MRRFWFPLILSLGLGILLATGGFFLWASQALPPLEECSSFLHSTDRVSVHIDPRTHDILFMPATHPTQGIIFFPGGKVDYRAYAPLLFRLADHGIATVLLSAAFHLAFFRADGATWVWQRYPEIGWYVAGHSLGGTVASLTLTRHPDKIKGLILCASYPATPLTNTPLPVLSIYGSRDGLIPIETFERKKSLLPPTTLYHVIEGGNHSQFGSYGLQPRDNPATISRDDQQRETLEAILDFLAHQP